MTESEWKDILQSPPSKLILPTLDRRRSLYKRIGWLYVLRNPGLAEGQLKVGMTSKFPERRALELSRSTAIPTPFQLVYYVHVGNRYEAEQHAHALLARHRLTDRKEFFSASIAEAVRALDDAAAHYPILLTTKKGRVTGIIPQDIQPRVVTCRACGQKSRIRDLLIRTVRRCGHCGTSFGG